MGGEEGGGGLSSGVIESLFLEGPNLHVWGRGGGGQEDGIAMKGAQ